MGVIKAAGEEQTIDDATLDRKQSTRGRQTVTFLRELVSGDVIVERRQLLRQLAEANSKRRSKSSPPTDRVLFIQIGKCRHNSSPALTMDVNMDLGVVYERGLEYEEEREMNLNASLEEQEVFLRQVATPNAAALMEQQITGQDQDAQKMQDSIKMMIQASQQETSSQIQQVISALRDVTSNLNEKVEEQNQKFDNIGDMLDSKLNNHAGRLETVELETNHLSIQVECLETENSNLKEQLDKQRDEMSTLNDKLKSEFELLRSKTLEAARQAHENEAHERRWAVRVNGLQAPAKWETTEEAKTIALTFFRDVVKADTLKIEDIDTCHRVGKVTANGVQTLLVRFHARDHANLVLKNRSDLKGTGFSIYEDATLLSRQMVNRLKVNTEVTGTWILNGKVYCRNKAGVKIHVDVFKSIDENLKIRN